MNHICVRELPELDAAIVRDLEFAADVLDSAVIAPLPAATANDTRDRWLYEECCRLTQYQTIINKLAKNAEWESIGTIQGIKRAANRYAKSHKLPKIPFRQPGRQPKQK